MHIDRDESIFLSSSPDNKLFFSLYVFFDSFELQMQIMIASDLLIDSIYKILKCPIDLSMETKSHVKLSTWIKCN